MKTLYAPASPFVPGLGLHSAHLCDNQRTRLAAGSRIVLPSRCTRSLGTPLSPHWGGDGGRANDLRDGPP